MPGAPFFQHRKALPSGQRPSVTKPKRRRQLIPTAYKRGVGDEGQVVHVLSIAIRVPTLNEMLDMHRFARGGFKRKLHETLQVVWMAYMREYCHSRELRRRINYVHITRVTPLAQDAKNVEGSLKTPMDHIIAFLVDGVSYRTDHTIGDYDNVVWGPNQPHGYIDVQTSEDVSPAIPRTRTQPYQPGRFGLIVELHECTMTNVIKRKDDVDGEGFSQEVVASEVGTRPRVRDVRQVVPKRPSARAPNRAADSGHARRAARSELAPADDVEGHRGARSSKRCH